MNQRPVPLDQAPVSTQTRLDTWQLIFDLERNMRYHTVLGDRYALRYRAIRFNPPVRHTGRSCRNLLPLRPTNIRLGLSRPRHSSPWIPDRPSTPPPTTRKRLQHYGPPHANAINLKTQAQRLWRDIEAYRITDTQAEQHLPRISQSMGAGNFSRQPGSPST